MTRPVASLSGQSVASILLKSHKSIRSALLEPRWINVCVFVCVCVFFCLCVCVSVGVCISAGLFLCVFVNVHIYAGAFNLAL